MRLRRGMLFVGLVALVASGVAAGRTAGWSWALPPGVTAPPVPADNPMTDARVALGRRLFYEGRLSVGGTMSCATCHEQHRAFASATAIHPGIGGNPGRRNVPGLANVGWLPVLTWHDPTTRTLEDQVATPLLGTTPVEMGGRPHELLARLSGDACYRQMFRAAFPEKGGAIDLTGIAAAIAAFERTFVSYGSPWDAWRRGDHGAIPPAAQAGAAVFARSCASCHAGPNLTDAKFHRLEPLDPQAEDRGAYEVTGNPADDGTFRTAPLRNVALTAPYLHDGSAATLAEAIRRHRLAGGEALSAEEMAGLVAFLDTLSDPAFVTNPALSRPTTACGRAS